MQPFHSDNPRGSALGALRILDDADKHKLLTVTAVAPAELSLHYSGAPKLVLERLNVIPYAPLTHGAILATLVFAENAGEPDQIEARLQPVLAFAESVGLDDRIPVVESLRNLVKEVEAVGITLEGSLPA